MKIFTAQNKTVWNTLLGVSICLLFFIITGTSSKAHALDGYTLDSNGCGYGIDDLIGFYSIKVGGVGLLDKHNASGNFNGSFDVNGVNGPIQKAYLFWTLRKPTQDTTLQLKINGKPQRNLTAHQTFGGAKLNSASTTYWGYVYDLTDAGSNFKNDFSVNSKNTFTISKNLDLSGNVEFFGAGVIIVHNDPSLTQKQHIELKCGFDATYYDNIGSEPTKTKWGEWSNVVCHRFAKDRITSQRNVQYYAFMSGTKEKSLTVYRPNSFWYVTGTAGGGGIPSSILNLNKSDGTPNQGLKGITGSQEVADLFNALSGNQWDTIDSTIGQPNISIPKNHDYICFQTQSINRPPVIGQRGRGSSMQWSMSALSFSDSAENNPSTPTPGSPTAVPPTPTTTPTPILFFPWINTVGGNVYSRTFDQTLLKDGQLISNSSVHDGKEAYLSTDLFIQPIGSATPNRSSQRNAYLNSYVDQNSKYRAEVTWFQYFSQYLNNSSRTDIVINNLTSNTITAENTSEIYADPSKVTIHKYSGDLNLDVERCDTKSIFLVEGNLNINPDLVAVGFDNGCMFVVSGTTTIQRGNSLGSSDGVPVTNYDQVHGYFITNAFETLEDPDGDGLFILGGIVDTDLNESGAEFMKLRRSLGPVRNQYSPSEIIEYDPRYLYIFGDLLTYPYGYTIRESQFIRTLQ